MELVGTGATARPSVWRDPPWVVVAVYFAIHLAVFVAIAAAPQQRWEIGPITAGPPAQQGMAGKITTYDGYFYADLAEHGYPDHVPEVASGDAAQSSVSFFPGYPLLVRSFDLVLPGGVAVAAFVATTLAGLVATLLLWDLVAGISGRAAGDRAAIVFVAFPGAFVFSLAYSEALGIALIVAAMLALARRSWILSGVLAALATLTRPDALALVLPLAWGAWVAIRDRREWRALFAPALAPLGTIITFVYVDARVGERFAFLRVEREAWANTIDLGKTTASHAVDTAQAVIGLQSTTLGPVLHTAGLLLTLAGLYAMWRWRPPTELWLYTGASLLTTLNPYALALRVVLRIFPLVAAIGVVLKGRLFLAVVAAFALGQVVLAYLVVSPAGHADWLRFVP